MPYLAFINYVKQRYPVDPLASTPENISYSLYVYVANNPIMYTDPTGMTKDGVEDDYKLHKDGTLELLRTTGDKHDVCLLYTSPSPRDRG